MFKPLVPKFRSDLSVRLRDIAEKQVPAKLKPIVVFYVPWPRAATDTYQQLRATVSVDEEDRVNGVSCTNTHDTKLC